MMNKTTSKSILHKREAIVKIVKQLVFIGGFIITATGAVVLFSERIQAAIQSNLLSLWGKQPPPPHVLPPRWLDKIYLLGWEALTLGILITIIGALLIWKWDQLVQLSKRKHFYLLTASVLLVCFWLPVMIWGHSGVIGGERVFWLGDDPMISMRYAQHLADGHGLVWNPDQRVEGYTNFGWTLIMSAVHLAQIPSTHTSLFIMLINLFLSLMTLLILIRLVQQLTSQSLPLIAVLLAFILNRNILFCTASGFETSLMILLFLLCIHRILKESRSNEPKPFTFILVGLLALVRADAVVFSGMLIVLALFLHQNKKKVFLLSFLTLLLPLAHVGFRLFYYGKPLPNTAYLKVMHWGMRFSFGLRYVLGFMKSYFFFVVFTIVGLFTVRKTAYRTLAGLSLLYILYVFYIGGDAFHHFRFFIPLIPLFFILAMTTIQQLRLFWGGRTLVTALCLAAMPLLFPGYSLFLLLPRPADQNNVELGLTLKNNTPATTKVADDWAGCMFYFSERYAIDFLGKSDAVIAHMNVVAPEARPGHNKFDYDYSLGELKPDLVVSHFKMPVTEEEMREESRGDWAFIGALYFNPVFQEHCFPNPLHLDTWRTVFVCDWSSLYPELKLSE